MKHLTNKKLIGLDLTHFIINTNIDFYVNWTKYGINNLKALDPRALFSLETADLLTYSDYGLDNSISTPTLANQLLAPKLPLTLEGIMDKKKLSIVIEKWDANGIITGYNLLGSTKRPITGIFSAGHLPLNVNLVYSNYSFDIELNEPGNNSFDGIFRMEGNITLDGHFKGSGDWTCFKCGLYGYFDFNSKNSWETI